jgi:hypothetical protein
VFLFDERMTLVFICTACRNNRARARDLPKKQEVAAD